MADVTPAPAPLAEHPGSAPLPDTPAVGTVPEAATALRVSRMTVYRLLDDGILEEVRIGTRRLVLWESVQRMLTPGETA